MDRKPDPGPGPGPGPDPDSVNNDDNEAKEGGDGGRVPKKRPPTGIRYKRNDDLGKIPSLIEIDAANNNLTVILNGSIPAIADAYDAPYKIPVLWQIISAAIADFCRRQAKDLEILFPEIIPILSNANYNVDPEDSEDLAKKIQHWLMCSQPQPRTTSKSVAA